MGGVLAKIIKNSIQVIALVLACLVAITAGAQDVLDQAKQLMRQGKAGEAFALLEPLESQRAGDIDFDYALGIAALDSAKPDRATIAFERVLAINPNFAGARLDLGRAYFAMGSDDLAKAEFETVRQLNPPENVRPIIAKYLDAIEARKKKEQPAFVGYVEAGAGADNNVTAVSSDFTGGVLQAYNIASVQPTGNSIKRSATFSNAGAGGDYTRPIGSGISVYLGGDARERHYYRTAAFSTQQFDARGGLAFAMERDALRVGLQGQKYYQEAETPISSITDTGITNDRSTSGYTAEWRHVLAPGRQFGLFAQFNRQRFVTNAPQNINQDLFGAQFLNVWEAKGSPLLFLSAYQSRDRALLPLNAAGTTDTSKSLTGLRAYTQYSPMGTLDLFLSVGDTARQDNSQFARSLTLAYGKDHTFDLTLGTNWRFVPNWSLRAQVAYYENHSNLSLYEYKRTEMSITLRRDFK